MSKPQEDLDLGSAVLEPRGPVKACVRGTWKIAYQAGKTGILPGGAVLAEELTREAIWDALYARRCFATTGARILLDVRCGDLLMGSEIQVRRGEALWKRREFRIRVLAPSPLEKVELLRNSEVIASSRTRRCFVDLTLGDDAPLSRVAVVPAEKGKCAYYYVRVRLADRQTAWASPFWFERDSVLYKVLDRPAGGT